MKMYVTNFNKKQGAPIWGLEHMPEDQHMASCDLCGHLFGTKKELLAHYAGDTRVELVKKPKSPANRTADAKVVVRMTAGLHDELKATAKANRRSMNTEILRRLSGTPSESELATAVMAAMHNKCFYAADGTLMTVEVKRSIFDDVDK